MACSTCDGYEFVPNPENAAGQLVDCPDCRAPRFIAMAAPLVASWAPDGVCPVHQVGVDERLRCPSCLQEAARGIAYLNSRHLIDRAREIALEAAAAA